MPRIRHIIGCMTGTSIDGLDAALVRIEGEGLSMTASLIAARSHTLGPLAPRLRALAEQVPTTAGEIAAIARDFSLAHAAIIKHLIDDARITPDLIAVHGQTIYHAPPNSWQLFNPAPLVEVVRLPVVFDLRAADLARGGQGAPITPIADYLLFASPHETRAIVNLGGFCNITILPRATDNRSLDLAAVQGFDVCACNHILNAIARTLLHADYDTDGRAALSGQLHQPALTDLVNVLAVQTRGSRSLGTGDEALDWLSRHRTNAAPNELAATACHAIALTIVNRTLSAQHIILAGGGVHNNALVQAIARASQATISPTETHGIPVSSRESVEIALLGALCQDRVPITLPAITGLSSPPPIAGVWAFSS